MAAGRSGGVIAVATSIPPALVRQDAGCAAQDYQALCIQSWIGNGFRVLSVNHADEVAALAQRYPEVTFVPTARDAREWTGRKNPYIADLLAALKEASEPVLGLINSDLLFEPSAAWTENLPSRVTMSMVVAHRYNTHSLKQGALRRFQGLDCFFFDKSTALRALETALPFAIGAPWWDYWLPCIALLNNRTVTVVDRPAILHLFHKAAYSGQSQTEFGNRFADAVIRESEGATFGQSPVFATVKPMLLDIAASPLEDAGLKRKFAHFCEVFISEIRKTVDTWEASNPMVCSDPANLKAAFEQFDQRLCAGEAFRLARTLLAENPPSDVRPDLVASLKQAPADPDNLLILGEISLRRGELDAASNYLAAAAELLPDAPGPLHRRGAVLNAMGKRQEALSCFRHALEIEPGHQPSCIAIAKIFWETARRQEAMDFLGEAIARHPGARHLVELRDSWLTNT